MSTRKYLPTFSELIDRLSIVQLKEIFIPENKSAYRQEISDIISDLDSIISEKDINITGDMIRAVLMIMLSNRYIWENESAARKGTDQDAGLLKKTHSINGVRNTAKNVISKEIGERVDLKVDCLAADLQGEHENWNVF